MALCWAHDPLLKVRAEEARKIGGRNSSNVSRASKRLPKDMKDVQAILLELIRDVHVAEGMSLQDKAVGVSRLAGTYVRVHETGELVQRLEELERRAEQNGGKRWA